MKKSDAYAITKLIQRFFDTALDIKENYLDTGSYTITDNPLSFGTEEKPSLRVLERRLSDMCHENDATYHMGLPYLGEDAMDAYASHIIDNGDIIASGKITTEKMSTLKTLIDFFDAKMIRDEQGFGGPDYSITAVYNTLNYIKEWEADYCDETLEEIEREHSASEEITEDEYTKQRRATPISNADIETIMGELHKFAYEMERITSWNYEHTIVFESASAAGVDFDKVNLYNAQQTRDFYKIVYDYSKDKDRRRFLTLFNTPYEGFPVKEAKRIVYDDETEPRDVLLFYYEAFICKWATLHVDLLRLYDYSITSGDLDILKDMKELLDDAQPNHLCFRYNRDSKHRGHYDETIYSKLSSFARYYDRIRSNIEKYFLRIEQGIVGEDQISNRKLIGLVVDFRPYSSAEGNKAHWTDKTVDRFMRLSVDDFVYVLRADFETLKRYGLKKFDLPSLQDIYDYVDIHSGSFNKDKMQLLLSQLKSANNNQFLALADYAIKQYSFEYEDDETGEKTIEYDEDTPLDENGKPIPEKCFEKMFGERGHEDEFRYNYAVGILYEKLGYQKDTDQLPFEIDNIKIYKYKDSAKDAAKEHQQSKRSMTAKMSNPVKDFVDSIMGVSASSLSNKLSDPYNLGKQHTLSKEMLNALNEAEGRIDVAYAHYLDNFEYNEGEEQYHPTGLTWAAILSSIRRIKSELGSNLVEMATNGKPSSDPSVQEAVAHYHELLNESGDSDISALQMYSFLKEHSDGFKGKLYARLISDIDKYAAKAYDNMVSISKSVFDVKKWNRPLYYMTTITSWDDDGNQIDRGPDAFEDIDTMVKVVFGTNWILLLATLIDAAREYCPQDIVLPKLAFIDNHIKAVKKESDGRMKLDESKLTSLKGLVIEIAETPEGTHPATITPSTETESVDKTPEFVKFNSMFNSENITRQERVALFLALKQMSKDESLMKPHLAICAAIIKMRKNPLKWIKPTKHSWSHSRDTILESIGMNPSIAKSVRETPETDIKKVYRDAAKTMLNRIK